MLSGESTFLKRVHDVAMEFGFTSESQVLSLIQRFGLSQKEYHKIFVVDAENCPHPFTRIDGKVVFCYTKIWEGRHTWEKLYPDTLCFDENGRDATDINIIHYLETLVTTYATICVISKDKIFDTALKIASRMHPGIVYEWYDTNAVKENLQLRLKMQYFTERSNT